MKSEYEETVEFCTLCETETEHLVEIVEHVDSNIETKTYYYQCQACGHESSEEEIPF